MDEARRQVLGASAGLLALLALLFPTVLRGEAFYVRDIHLQWYGQMEAWVGAVAAGAWPLWDPGRGFGQPLLANANNQLFYPTTLLNLVLRPWHTYTLLILGHGLFSGVGCVLLGRRLGFSPWAAFLSAGVWIASGPFLSLANAWNHFVGAAWLPWTLLAADRALAAGRAWPAVLWGAALAAQVLAGSPDFAVLTALLTAAWALRPLLAERGRRPALLRTAAVAALFAVLLPAAQLLPSAELARQAGRLDMPREERVFWSQHPAGLPLLVLPVLWGDLVWTPAWSSALFEGREPFLPSLYLGSAAGLLVLAALASPWRERLLPLVLAAGAALLFALGRHAPFYDALTAVLPFLKALRFPTKALVVVAFVWALLAGLGLDAWRARASDLRLPLLSAGAAILHLAGAAVLLAAPGVLEAVLQRVVDARLPLALLVAAAATAVLGLALRRQARPALLVLPVLADLAATGGSSRLNPTAPPGLFTARPEVLAALEPSPSQRLNVYDYDQAPGLAQKRLGRPDAYRAQRRPGAPSWLGAAALRAYLLPPIGEAWGVRTSFDRDLLNLDPEPLGLLAAALTAMEGTAAHLRLLQVAAVSQVIALHEAGLERLQPVGLVPSLLADPIRVFRVPDPRPRAYAVSGAAVADGRASYDVLMSEGFDPATSVLLPRGTAVPPRPGFVARVQLAEERADEVVLDADLSHGGWVVLVDAFAPGWTADLDGRPVEVQRANVAFRAVSTPAGHHRVRFRYRPASVAWGLALSVGAVAAAAALGARPHGAT